MICQNELDTEIKRLLNALYGKRFTKLSEVNLQRLLKKNPFLFRAIGLTDTSELVESMLDAFLSSSDETYFGNDFFEPLAFWVAKNAIDVSDENRESVSVGSASGTDLAIETANSYLAIAVKSGTNIFNSQSTKGQSTEFVELQSRLRKLGKEIRPIIGYGYGRNKSKATTKHEKHAGQAFWKLLSGEHNFYLRICDSIGKFSLDHKEEYDLQYKRTKNKILKQLVLNFVDDSGDLNWRKIFEFNSSIEKPNKLKE
jgi:hypothetical protein